MGEAALWLSHGPSPHALTLELTAAETSAACLGPAEISPYLKSPDQNIVWACHLGLVRRFRAEHGRLPERGEVYVGAPLGHWCVNQRNSYRRSLLVLLPEQVQALEALPGWWWVRTPTWQARLCQLKEYVALHGSVPMTKEIYQGVALGSWCSMQRRAYKAASAGLTRERIQALEAVPTWWWRK